VENETEKSGKNEELQKEVFNYGQASSVREKTCVSGKGGESREKEKTRQD